MEQDSGGTAEEMEVDSTFSSETVIQRQEDSTMDWHDSATCQTFPVMQLKSKAYDDPACKKPVENIEISLKKVTKKKLMPEDDSGSHDRVPDHHKKPAQNHTEVLCVVKEQNSSQGLVQEAHELIKKINGRTAPKVVVDLTFDSEMLMDSSMLSISQEESCLVNITSPQKEDIAVVAEDLTSKQEINKNVSSLAQSKCIPFEQKGPVSTSVQRIDTSQPEAGCQIIPRPKQQSTMTKIELEDGALDLKQSVLGQQISEHLTSSELIRTQPLTSDKDKGEALFAQYLRQTDQKDRDHRTAVRNGISQITRSKIYEDIIDIDDVRCALKRKKDVEQGPGGVKHADMKNLSEDKLKKMAACFNLSLEIAELPQEWLRSYLVLPSKSGKNHSELNNHRINLQNIFGQVLEKIVASKLQHYLERHKLLPRGLGSYRLGRDKLSNAATFAFDVNEGFENEQDTVAVALDLEDAYNRVRYDVLIHTLSDMKVCPWIVKWIAAALYECKVAFCMDSWTSDPCTIAPGLIHKSPLSSVLFNVYTSKIAAIEAPGTGRILTYGNNILVYRHGGDREKTTEDLQSAVNMVMDWCKHSGINPGKSSFVLYSLNKIEDAEVPGITLNGEPVSKENKLRYLGITFDSRLSFKDHIQKVIERAKRELNELSRMANEGKTEEEMLKIFKQRILPVIENGLGLLTLSNNQLEKLEDLQNVAMRCILRCKDIIYMQYKLALPSVVNRHKLLQAKLYLGVAADKEHPLHECIDVIKGHISWAAQAKETIGQVCKIENIWRGHEWERVPVDRSGLDKVIITLGRKCRSWAPGLAEAKVQQLIKNNTQHDSIVIYTDGSVRHKHSGCSFKAYNVEGQFIKDECWKYKIELSSTRMEVEGVTKAFHWLEGITTNQVVFLTDSQKLLEKVKKMFHVEWLASIKRSKNNFKTVWIYCPGHAHVKGNEQADKLAKEAQLEGELFLGIQDVVKMLLKHMKEMEEDPLVIIMK